MESLGDEQLAEHAATLATTTPDVVPVTALEEIASSKVEIAPPTGAIVAPTMERASPTFEVVADSPDVRLRIFPATSSDARVA